MKIYKRIGLNQICEIASYAMMISIWAFNEEKIISYAAKIIYIIFLGIYCFREGRFILKFQKWCFLMTLISLVGLFISDNFSISLHTFINLIQVYLISYVTYGYIDSKEKAIKFIKMLVISGVVLAIRLIIVTPIEVWKSWERLGEEIGYNANDVGNKMALTCTVALFFAKTNKKFKKIFYYIIALLAFVVVLFSGSRKSLLAVAIAIFILYIFTIKDKRWIGLVFIALGILAFIGYRIIIDNKSLYWTIGRRVESMIKSITANSSYEDGSMSIRKTYMIKAIELIKESPIFGIGLNQFSQKSGYGVYCHCDYLETACSFGIPGSIILYLPSLWIVKQTIAKRLKSDDDHLVAAIIFMLLFMFITMVMYTSAYVYVLIAIMYSYCKMSLLESENKEKEIYG